MKLLLKLRGWGEWLLARWYYGEGMTRRQRGNSTGAVLEYEAAVAAFDRALMLDPGFARAYLDRGTLYWRELDHPRKALLDLNQALALAPDLHEALFNRGVAHQQLGEYALAVADFRAYLAVGQHPYWREYAEKMVDELAAETQEEIISSQ